MMKQVSKSTLVFSVAIIPFLRNSDIILEKGIQIFSENSFTVKKSGRATSCPVLSAIICFVSSRLFSLLSIHRDFFARLNVPSSSSTAHLILNVFFDLNFLPNHESNPEKGFLSCENDGVNGLLEVFSVLAGASVLTGASADFPSKKDLFLLFENLSSDSESILIGAIAASSLITVSISFSFIFSMISALGSIFSIILTSSLGSFLFSKVIMAGCFLNLNSLGSCFGVSGISSLTGSTKDTVDSSASGDLTLILSFIATFFSQTFS
jgi:hypothetical protein